MAQFSKELSTLTGRFRLVPIGIVFATGMMKDAVMENAVMSNSRVPERRSANRHSFVAPAEVECHGVMREARVTDLCIQGCYLAMPEPFSKGSPVLVKIRTNRQFFQSHGIVAHCSFGIGMGLRFDQLWNQRPDKK